MNSANTKPKQSGSRPRPCGRKGPKSERVHKSSSRKYDFPLPLHFPCALDKHHQDGKSRPEPEERSEENKEFDPAYRVDDISKQPRAGMKHRNHSISGRTAARSRSPAPFYRINAQSDGPCEGTGNPTQPKTRPQRW